jgi:hypothetical protein
MELIRKHIDPETMPVLFEADFTPEAFQRDFDVRGGAWRVEDGWLIGKNPENAPGMVISHRDFFGDVCLDFKDRTVPPSTHDIDAMWNGGWDYETNTRGVAYVAGLEGWWEGKVGFEKSPDYQLNVATQLLDFVPGRVYHVQCGSIAGHVFVLVDGRLALEATDPDPIDTARFGRVGFEAYASHIAVTDFKVRRAVFTPTDKSYAPEF